MIKGYVKVVNRLSKYLENISMIIVFLTAMLIIANVLLRRIINMPIVGAHDLVLFFTSSAIALSLAYCAVKDGHIYISILVEKFPKKVQKVIDFIIGTISALFLMFISWHMFLYAETMKRTKEVSLTIHIPHYPFVIIMAIGFAVLGLVVIGHVLSLFVKEGEQ